MPLPAGSRLGPYEIVAPLGAGGMGEVYRARDSRLNREVALKILPAAVSGDPGRRQRFELEARAVAALNHPNIVAVYDVGENYMVSELVDGESLRGAKFGLRKTVDTVVQIAAGMAAAHKAGITHRDLKPDNILLTRDGRVKILDFGLAKVHNPGGAATETPTRTDPGTVMGTVGYMSPEQVRGQEIGHASDIFSFGVILYELLAGKRTFSGESSVDTLHAILHQEPAELPESVPAPLRRIVARCLEKDPAHRFESAGDLAFALREAGSGAAAPPAARASRNRRWPAAVMAGVVVAVAAWPFFFRSPVQPFWTATPMGGPEVAFLPRLSPDGHTLAMLTLVDGQSQIAVMRPDAGDWALLTHDRDLGWGGALSWSPDGDKIYYDRFSDVPKGIYSVPVLGGAPHLVLENAAVPEALPDGSLLLSRLNSNHQFQVFRYWPETGKSREYPLQTSFNLSAPYRTFPDGRQAAILARPLDDADGSRERLYVLDLASGSTRLLAPDVSLGIAVPRGGLSVLSSTPSSGIVSYPAAGGPSRTLFPLTSMAWAIDQSPDGSLYVDQLQKPFHLVRLSGGHAGIIAVASLPVPATSIQFTALPDGRFLWMERVGARSRVIIAEPGKPAAPLVNTAEETGLPGSVAGPDRAAVLIGPDSNRQIAMVSISTGRVLNRLSFDKGVIDSLVAAPDGRTVYCASNHAVWAIPVSGGPITRVHDGDRVAVDPAGRFLIVMSLDASTTRLLKVPLDGGSPQEIPVAGSLRPAGVLGGGAVNPDGRLLVGLASPDSWFFRPGIVDLATGKVTRIPADFEGDYYSLNWAPDGSIVAAAVPMRSSIWKFTPASR